MPAVPAVIFEDLQCPDSAAFDRMLRESLLPRYGNRVSWEHRDFPLPKHSWARQAAIIARYFSELDPQLGLDFRSHMLADPKAPDFPLRLAGFTRARSLVTSEAAAALSDGRLAALVDKDYRDGLAQGVAKTPTVFVGNETFSETFSVAEISLAIDQAIAAAA
jgi:protein-disulfide isomerase